MYEKVKLSVNCSNLVLAKKLINLNVKNIIVGLEGFSTRFNSYFSLQEIEELTKIKNKSHVSVFLNVFFFEQDLPKLEMTLIALSKINIDYLIFNDFAIPQIVYEKNLKFNLHYNSETLNTNYNQIDFFEENKIFQLTLANELTLNEIKKISLNKKNTMIEVQIFGLAFIMYSRWEMISSYIKNFNYSQSFFKNQKFLFIREDLRKNPVILFEDNYGTHMMTGFLTCGIKKINIFKDIKMDFLRIDSLFIEDETLINIVKIFLNAINNQLEQADLNKAYEQLEKLVGFKLSENFLNFPKGLLHMEKFDEK